MLGKCRLSLRWEFIFIFLGALMGMGLPRVGVRKDELCIYKAITLFGSLRFRAGGGPACVLFWMEGKGGMVLGGCGTLCKVSWHRVVVKG